LNLNKLSLVFFIKALFVSKKVHYIYVTVITSLLSIFKSYILMRMLSLSEMGIISFIQSIIVFVSFFQIGLLNGGYRLVSKLDLHLRRINDFIFSYIFYLLWVAIILVLPIYFLFDFSFDLFILIYSIVAGFITIISNWVTNLLIANQKIDFLNKANLISLASSFLCLFLIKISPLWSGILFITSQSFFLVFVGLYLGGYKFRITYLNKRTFKYIFLVGFTPFLINMIGSFFLLFEKWLITADLGINSLGKYYLVGVYSTLFQLVPSALNNLEFPNATRTLGRGMNSLMMLKEFKLYFLKLFIYVIVAGILTYTLTFFVIDYFLPQYKSSVYLIKIVYWGLALTTISQPINLVFQVKYEYKKTLSVYLVSILFAFVAYYIFTFKDTTNLETYAYISLFFNIVVGINFCLFFWKSTLIKNLHIK
jgi:O-antigen/teichoic acid export membrane protein